MCGICGFLSKKNISLEQLKEMNDTMYHRGPNDSGEEIYGLRDGYALGLAQRRLSIMDLSPLGHQPMHSKSGRVSIVFNGEIYNFLELKEELSDYPFCSNCDTEVILVAYEKWGVEAFNKIKGMFAIALFDREQDKVYLIRDRAGKKPLYYWMDGDNMVFASELKPIMKCPGFPKKINTDVLNRYMYHFYIQAPDTIFERVYQLEPGMIVAFDLRKIGSDWVKSWKYWDIPKVYQEQKQHMVGSYEEAKEGLKQRLIQATRQRMIADVPLGTFLSGGYDSSLVTAIAQSISDKPVKTFCIGFHEPKKNEAEYAKAIANHLGTDHKELYIEEKDLLNQVSTIAQYFDEPFADSSQIPSMLVAKLAREDVTVVLSGDGGDELFCGYNVYPKVGQAQKLDVLGAMTYGACQLPGLKQMKLLEKMPFAVRVIAKNRDPLTKTQIGGETYISQIQALLKTQGLPVKYQIEDRYQEKNWQARRMLLDEQTYLPGDILCKVDRASMKYSLEARCPILDTDVWEYSYRIPHTYKFYQGDKKHILKDIAYDYIPKELLERPKVGFSVPLDQWLRGPLKEQLIAYSRADYLKKQNLFHETATQNFIDSYLLKGDKGASTGENYSKTAWTFFVFQQWYETYIKA